MVCIAKYESHFSCSATNHNTDGTEVFLFISLFLISLKFANKQAINSNIPFLWGLRSFPNQLLLVVLWWPKIKVVLKIFLVEWFSSKQPWSFFSQIQRLSHKLFIFVWLPSQQYFSFVSFNQKITHSLQSDNNRQKETKRQRERNQCFVWCIERVDILFSLKPTVPWLCIVSKVLMPGMPTEVTNLNAITTISTVKPISALKFFGFSFSLI